MSLHLPPALQQFMPVLVLCLIFGSLVTAPIVMVVRRRRSGVTFPPLDRSRVLYCERWASGCSHRTSWTRLGSVSNCVSVVVIEGEVRVWVTFPFTFLGYDFDLEHHISREAIRGLEERPYFFNRVPFLDWLIGRKLLLDYTDKDGHPHRIELVLHRSLEFLKALNTKPELDH